MNYIIPPIYFFLVDGIVWLALWDYNKKIARRKKKINQNIDQNAKIKRLPFGIYSLIVFANIPIYLITYYLFEASEYRNDVSFYGSLILVIPIMVFLKNLVESTYY